MACSHYLIAYQPEPGDQLIFWPNGDSEAFSNIRLLPYEKAVEAWHKRSYSDPRCMLVPCQQCIGCRLEYSRLWANRMVLEAMGHKHNYFVTLTYDDDHLPPWYYDPDKPCVELPDIQNFFKRLRINLSRTFLDPDKTQCALDSDGKFRYYYCSEYGDQNGRPHFHFCCFGLLLPDLQYFGVSRSGSYMYSSELLNKTWPFGFVAVEDFNWSTASYVAGYVLKKRKGKASAEWYAERGLTPVFNHCSNGIARSYFDANKEQIYEYDEISIISKDDKVRRIRPPRYFDDRFEDPERIRELKEQRREVAIAQYDQRKRKTDRPFWQDLDIDPDHPSFLTHQNRVLTSRKQML